MTARSAIPPIVSDGDHTQEALGLLQKRLQVAEDDTKDLVSQLAQMGFHGDPQHEGIMPIAPYKVRVADSQVLHQNYEVLVSRVCKMESAIQTMKLNLLRAQAERDLSKEEKMAANEKLTSTSDAYEKELAKTNRELVQCRKDLKDAIEERRKGQEDIRRLQETVDAATSSKSEALVMVEDHKSSKAKLTRRVNELREEVARESSLRASLEESHNTLLTRIQEVESIVQHEQDEVKNLNTICAQLKRDSLRAREEAELERSLRLQAEDSLQKFTSQSGDMHSQMSTLQEDKAYLMGEMNKMRTRYNELIQQLDQTHKLVNDKQSTHEQLEKENKRLHEAMTSTASQNARLIAKYEEEIESLKTDVAAKMQMEEKIKHLSEQLRLECREKGHALSTSSQLNAKSQELEDKVRHHEEDIEEMRARHQREIAELRETLRNKETEKERIMKDKDSLLDEVNQAVDEMVEERTQLQSQLQQAKISQESATQTRKQLEEENRRLLERLGALEEQANAAGQIETAMTEMMEQKNKLAYDKGRLQNRVGELQREVESLASGQSDLAQLRKVASATETNYKKSQTELNNARIMIQRLESRVQQLEVSGQRKEEDFSLAIKARDEAVKEAQHLLSHIGDVEDRERQKVVGLERSLGETRQDNKKVASTLESVMQSHTQLQFTVEGLQIELGKKDAQINQLFNEKSELQNRNRQLQKELDNLQSKLVSMETLDANEIGPLRRVIHQCKSDNTKMASSLETVVKSNSKLQVSMEGLKDELEKKSFVLEQLQEVRDREGEAHQQQIRTYEERLENMKEQLNREREKSLKKGNKEILEIRKQVEDLVSKNGELSRANSDLRHRITDLEYETREYKEKIASNRSQVEHLTKIRQKQEDSLKNLQVVSSQLEVLERSNKEYVKKNDHQAKMIRKFMSQMTNLQEELQGLAQSQSDTASILQQQEDQLRRERSRYDELKRKYRDSRKRESELEELRRQTEDKLREANNESLQISSNLTDAHSWFKSKFETLQTELKKSRLEREGDHNALFVETLRDEIDAYRKNQAGLINENFEQKQLLEEEQRKAQETAEKARQMIKSSRETIGRLADYAEVAQKETSTQMRDLYEKLESEKDYARHTEAKYKGLKVSSLRHTEQLARELDLLRSHSYMPYDSLNSSGS